MTKLGKFWTGAVAYVSLLVGAGLSVAGNLADTYRTRGADVDTLDKVMAAGWPILVLLAIEMFVSPRWSDKRMFQVWRWVGCLAVGGMAMTVSWTHLHDLMASRGQLLIVSVLGPLAIDGMAIMATGLILSTRVRGHAAMAVPNPDVRVRMSTPEEDMDMSGYWTDSNGHADKTVSADGYSRGRWADLVTDDAATSKPVAANLMAWVSGHEQAITDAGQELAAEAERVANGQPPVPVPVVSGDLPRRTRTAGGSVPQEFMDMVAAWDPSALKRADMVKLSAVYFQVSTRTARRWLAASLGEPVSGPPAQD